MLVAEPGRHRDALAPLGATARKHGLAALGLHTLPESVHLGAFAAIGLKCALGHARTALLVEKNSVVQTPSISEGEHKRQTGLVFGGSDSV